MYSRPQRTDPCKHRESHRHDLAEHPVVDRDQIFHRDDVIELAFARSRPRPELVAQLGEGQSGAGLVVMISSRILKPIADRFGTSARATMAVRIMKKPLIGSLKSAFSTRRDSLRGERGFLGDAVLVPFAEPAALDEARADDEIERGIAPAACPASAGNNVSSCCRSPSITATIGGGGRTHPLDTGGRQPAPADPLDHAHPRRRPAPASRAASAVPSALSSSTKIASHTASGQRLRRASPTSSGDVRALVEGRDDDRDFEKSRRDLQRVRPSKVCQHRIRSSPSVESAPPRVRGPRPARDRRRDRSLDPIRRARASPASGADSIAADRIAAHGLALPCPAISGAEPWIGSYRPLSPLHARSDADGSIPIEPGAHARLVGQDVAEQIARHDDVELAGIAHHLHRGVVDIHVRQRDVGIMRRTSRSTTSRHNCDVSSTFALSTEQSFFLRCRAISKPTVTIRRTSASVIGHDVIALADRPSAVRTHPLLAEIHVAGQFAQDHHVDRAARSRVSARKRPPALRTASPAAGSRTGPSRLSQAQDRLFGAQERARERIARRIADRAEQDRVRTPSPDRASRGGSGWPCRVIGGPADGCLLEIEGRARARRGRGAPEAVTSGPMPSPARIAIRGMASPLPSATRFTQPPFSTGRPAGRAPPADRRGARRADRAPGNAR